MNLMGVEAFLKSSKGDNSQFDKNFEVSKIVEKKKGGGVESQDFKENF